MTVKRKPTLKQLFIAWKKYQKKSNEVWDEKNRLNQLARNIEWGTELVSDEDSVYRVTVTNSRGDYTIEKIASKEELVEIK
jgi:hypothetical protein